jgi:imidazolonepropionase-like amidohydrolase
MWSHKQCINNNHHYYRNRKLFTKITFRSENNLLRGIELRELPIIENAFLLIEDGNITKWGLMENLKQEIPVLTNHQIDATGQFVMPTWCDSHTHMVFAGSRENEFVDKINGLKALAGKLREMRLYLENLISGKYKYN